MAVANATSPWPMKTSSLNPDGSSVARGACIECRDPKTVNQLLISFDCKGAVCHKCAALPQYAKRLKEQPK